MLESCNKQAGIWGALLVSPDWKKEAVNSPMSAPLAQLKSMFFSLNFDENGFVLNITGTVGKEKQISQVKEAFQNYLDALKGWGAGTPEFLQLLKMAKVTAVKGSASVDLVVKKAVFEDLMAKLGKRAQGKN